MQVIESILSQLRQQASKQKETIQAFYKQDVEQTLTNLEHQNRFLQRGIVSEKDQIVASQMRGDTSISPFATVQTWQLIVLAVLGVAALFV